MTRLEKAWDLAQSDRLTGDLADHLDGLPEIELRHLEWAAARLLRETSRKIDRIEREKIRKRIERYGHANGLHFKDRPRVG